MRFVDLTYLEIAARARAGALAIVPLGCTEQQGPHLGVGLDTWFAQELTETASARVEAQHGVRSVVLPAQPFGPTPEHRGFGAGFIDLPRAVHDALLEAILESLADQGFAHIVVWRGCGGHDLRGVVAAFNDRHAGDARVWLPEHAFHDLWLRLGDQRDFGGHADSFATSIALYRHPELVREQAVPGPSREPDWDDPALDFTRYSDTGVIGDPRYANAGLGARLWEECVDEVVAVLRDVAQSTPAGQ